MARFMSLWSDPFIVLWVPKEAHKIHEKALLTMIHSSPIGNLTVEVAIFLDFELNEPYHFAPK